MLIAMQGIHAQNSSVMECPFFCQIEMLHHCDVVAKYPVQL